LLSKVKEKNFEEIKRSNGKTRRRTFWNYWYL